MADPLTGRVIRAAIAVHSELGPGLLESTYHACLSHEFMKASLAFEHQVRLPVKYDSINLEAGYRIDFLVEGEVIVELKSVTRLLPLHVAQLLTYLRLSHHRVGLLINFNVPHLRDGIKRVVNGYRVPALRIIDPDR